MPGPSPEEYAPLGSGESITAPPPNGGRYPQLILWARRLISSSILALFCIGILSLGLVDHFTLTPVRNSTLNAVNNLPTLSELDLIVLPSYLI